MTRAEEAAWKAYPQKGDNVISQEGYRLMRSIYVDGHEAGYKQAEKDTIEKAVEWLRERINIPQEVLVNEDGEPLADSYIAYAKRRLEVANEIIDDFRKSMEEEYN